MIGSENTILYIFKLSKNEERKGVKYMFGVHDPQNPANVWFAFLPKLLQVWDKLSWTPKVH